MSPRGREACNAYPLPCRRAVCGRLRRRQPAGPVLLSAFRGRRVGRSDGASQEVGERVRSLLDRITGSSMPEGIVKTNGRIEATQVDVAAKYPGRLVDITVEEGSEVKAGQVVGRVSSPEYEAQLRAAQSNVDKAQQALAEAESLIAQRNAVLAAAKSDFERGKELVGKQIITQQTFDQRQRNYEGSEASVKGAIAQRDQAEAAIKSAQAEVERIESILNDLVLDLAADRTGAISARAQWRSGRGWRQGADDPRSARCLHDGLLAGGGRGQTRNRRRSPHHPGSGTAICRSCQRSALSPPTRSSRPRPSRPQEEREKLMFRVKLRLDAEVLKQYSSRT